MGVFGNFVILNGVMRVSLIENVIFGGEKFRYVEIWVNSISGGGNRLGKVSPDRVCLIDYSRNSKVANEDTEEFVAKKQLYLAYISSVLLQLLSWPNSWGQVWKQEIIEEAIVTIHKRDNTNLS